MIVDSELLIFETRCWFFATRNKQLTLVSAVLGSKSNAASFHLRSDEDFWT